MRYVFLVLVLAASLVAPARAADPLTIHATPVLLDVNDAERRAVGRLVYRGGLILQSPDRRFGGWSDLSVSPDGTRVTAISDDGFWLDAALRHDAAGNVTGLANARLGELIDLAGRPLYGKSLADAEGLTAFPDGSFLVAFERRHRLWLYPAAEPPFSVPPRIVPSPVRLKEAPSNGGIEAVLRLSGGRILALTEDFIEHGDNIGWLGDGLKWEELRYRAAPDFKPVSAAEFPSGTPEAGDVLILERRITLFSGPAVRIVLLRRADIQPGVVIEGEELAILRPPMTLDNFEGIAIARDASGAARIYLLSDDNYSVFQRTLLFAFGLRPTAE